ncbi:hypothetical protein MBLNU13_g01517t1 [Cladosporium sp. NU13]
MSSTFQAQCHCGHHKWEWTLESDKQSHILCHCDTCKVLSGGPYTLNQIVPKSALKITSGGEPAKYSYKGDSGNSVDCYYCPKCTVHIYHHQTVMGPDTIIARTGIPVDARKKFPVAAEIYGKDKLNWEPKIAETFDVLPPS